MDNAYVSIDPAFNKDKSPTLRQAVLGEQKSNQNKKTKKIAFSSKQL